jgi:16S rRNA (cytosine967-C5)-methyltransferase
MKQRGAEGFVNGLLRSVLRQGPRSIFADPRQDPAEYASTWLSHPRWIVDRWLERLGPAETIELCEAQNRRPTLVLRARPGGRESLLDELRERGWDAKSVDFAPDAVEMVTRVPATALLDAIESEVVIQDAAAQLVAPLLVEDGVHRVVDLCAAPGGKAVHLAQCLVPGSQVLALDVSAVRLRSVSTTLRRLQLAGQVQPLVADGRWPCLREQSLDAVLVDAPCTGTGVLARRHEARWLREPADLLTMPELQTELLHRATDLVAPGGWIVYATCSLEPEENDEVVDRVLAERDDVVEVGVGSGVPRELQSSGRLQVWPHRHGTDGAFAARLRRLPLPDHSRQEESSP